VRVDLTIPYQLLERRQSTIFVLGHCGNWEWAIPIAVLSFPNVLIHVVYHPDPTPGLRRADPIGALALRRQVHAARPRAARDRRPAQAALRDVPGSPTSARTCAIPTSRSSSAGRPRSCAGPSASRAASTCRSSTWRCSASSAAATTSTSSGCARTRARRATVRSPSGSRGGSSSRSGRRRTTGCGCTGAGGTAARAGAASAIGLAESMSSARWRHTTSAPRRVDATSRRPSPSAPSQTPRRPRHGATARRRSRAAVARPSRRPRRRVREA
jgi:hypothetical protein